MKIHEVVSFMVRHEEEGRGRWDGRQTVAFTYRVPGVLEPIRGLAGIDEFVIEVQA